MWMAKPVDCSLVSHFLLANMTTLSQNAVGGSSGADGGKGIGPSSNRF